MQESNSLKISSSAYPAIQTSEFSSAPKYAITKKSGKNLTSVYQEEQDYKIFIGKLPHSITKEQIVQHFSKYGKIQRVNIVQKQDRKLNFGFVYFCGHEAVKRVFGNLVSDCYQKFSIKK